MHAIHVRILGSTASGLVWFISKTLLCLIIEDVTLHRLCTNSANKGIDSVSVKASIHSLLSLMDNTKHQILDIWPVILNSHSNSACGTETERLMWIRTSRKDTQLSNQLHCRYNA